jgi:hypothetical protein
MSRTYGLSSDLALGFGIRVKGGAGIDINIFNQGTAPKEGTITTTNSISGQFLFFGATYNTYPKDQESFQSSDFNIVFPGGFSMDANTGLKSC